MIVTFERDPLGWVHPFYRRHLHHHPSGWDNFVRPALETFNNMFELTQQHEPRVIQSLASQRANNREKFELKMDVEQFAPEELEVKLVDNCLVVEGKHEEKKDEHGFVSRHFMRRYQLPEDVKPESVTCNLSSNGVLIVSAPRMIEEKPTNERSVPINFTGQPAAVTNGQNKGVVASQEEKNIS